MLESVLLEGATFTLSSTLLIICSSIILGLMISLSYMKTHQHVSYSPSFTITLIMLPVIISIIILMIGNNVARAFSLAGAFSIIRFRSAPGDPKDIAYIFFTLAVGLACGMGYILYGVLFTFVLCSVMLVLEHFQFGAPKIKNMQLKITIPEDLNYEGVFDDILDAYSKNWSIKQVRTRDFGALFELHYLLTLKPELNQKKLIDELRCRNGNLNISLTCGSYFEQQ